MDKDEVDAKANRLIYVKKSIAELQEEEKEIKEKLEPHVGSVEPLLMRDGINVIKLRTNSLNMI